MEFEDRAKVAPEPEWDLHGQQAIFWKMEIMIFLPLRI